MALTVYDLNRLKDPNTDVLRHPSPYDTQSSELQNKEKVTSGHTGIGRGEGEEEIPKEKERVLFSNLLIVRYRSLTLRFQ